MLARSNDIELDHGPRSRGLERLCVATREVRPVETMIRFVVAPNGEAVADLKRNLPGRGVWVTATRRALDQAIKASAFARGFRRDVCLAADLAAQTERLLETAALDALAMAHKTGLVVIGFARIGSALARECVAALVHAAEAAPDGVNKLGSALRQRRQAEAVRVVRILTSAQLDLALGRPNVIHAALLAGRASETFMARLRRLERFRNGEFAEESGPERGESGPGLARKD
ncbi:MAG TPA: RNA-binding protein [Xanthobacteraceae bacterium]|jgi:predicted RNA-binding protein YlxR (DUF448 family)|nr:RNA-binding protein [Xanthobacteraceae bacterium]HYQ05538.1 RNA-binding protein [Xanthobacteraceae bacterium]